jgi:hypothetical protein
VSLLVWPFAVQTTRTVHANAVPVLEIDYVAVRRLSGLLFRKLVYHCNDPAMLLHGFKILVFPEGAGIKKPSLPG